jgi:hypothetical protein
MKEFCCKTGLKETRKKLGVGGRILLKWMLEK